MQRILALDLGEKYIGTAVSDALNIIAQSVGRIERKNLESDFKKIELLIKEYGIATVVVGLPLNMDGSQGKSAHLASDFANKLKEWLDVSVEMIDERLTTAQGERMFLEADLSRKKRRKNIDKIAAQLILQNYLDLHKGRDV